MLPKRDLQPRVQRLFGDNEVEISEYFVHAIWPRKLQEAEVTDILSSTFRTK